METRSQFAIPLVPRPVKHEVKSLADPEPDLFALFGLVQSSAGVMVSQSAALRVPAVNAAIRLISEAAAVLPRMVKEILPNGDERNVPDHWAMPLLNGEANDWTSGYELVRDLLIDALSEDRGGMVWANRLSTGKVHEFIRYRAGVLTVDYDQLTGQPSYRNENRIVEASNMVHLRSPFGRAPLTLAREAIAIAIVLEQHASSLFGKGARPSGYLKFPKGMGADAVAKARAMWRETHEAEGESGKTAILYDGAEFEAATFKSTDAQFLENRKFQITEVSRSFRVPPPLLFDLEKASYANVEQLRKEFTIYCLEPWLCATEAAFGRALFAGEDRGRFVVRFDRDDHSRADLQTRATTINSLIASEVINPDEGRSWLGMEPRKDGGGQVFGNRNINPDQGGRPTTEEGGKPDGL